MNEKYNQERINKICKSYDGKIKRLEDELNEKDDIISYLQNELSKNTTHIICDPNNHDNDKKICKVLEQLRQRITSTIEMIENVDYSAIYHNLPTALNNLKKKLMGEE